MASESRVRNSLINARVNVIFYILVLGITFFSRKIFFDLLGKEFVGLTYTITNILGLINLAELGVGNAIGYMLYKPLFEKDTDKISQIIAVFGYVYNRIGYVILGAGIILSFFLPLIFRDTEFSTGLIYFAFYSVLCSTLLSYFANYKQLLLGADQRQYVVNSIFQSVNIVRLLTQMYIAYKFANLYLWVAMELCFSIIYSLLINWRLRRIYPWLNATIKKGKKLFREFPEVVKYTKQLFVHRVSSTVLFNLSPVFIYAYTSLTIVAVYSNYAMIIDKVSQFISQIVSGLGASVGHLVAQNDKERIASVFNQMLALDYFIAGICCIGIYFSIDPFITLWLGPDYIVSNITLFILLFNIFLALTRTAVGTFLYAHGLFYDIWAPLTEAGINILVSVVGGMLWGINGVLLGTSFSLLGIVYIWKPVFLFRAGFKKSIRGYWLTVGKYIAVNLTCGLVIWLFTRVLSINPSENYINWLLYTIIILFTTTILIGSLMYVTSQGMKDLIGRIFGMIRKKFTK